MLNPLFWIFISLTLVFCYFSLLNWKLGLLLFFIYIQFFGIIKRIILFIGLDNMFYNILVGFQYLFLICIITGSFLSSLKNVNPSSKVRLWLLLFSVMLFIGLVLCPSGMGIALQLVILQFLPVYIFIVGPYLEPKLVEDLKNLLIKTAPIHAIYQIYQFVFGAFAFEISFVDSKSSVVASFEGDFMRGIPLYDSVDPLYLHFALVFLFLLKNKKSLFSYVSMFLMVIALIVIGNRSGLIILFLSVVVWMMLEWKTPLKKFLISSFIILIVSSLSIFGLIFMDFIKSVESLNLGQSDFGSRLSTLTTYADRIIGRQKASEHTTVFGLGIGSSGLAATTLANKGSGYEAPDRDIFAHDFVGEIILDFGVFGLFVFALLIWMLTKYSINIKEDSPYLAMILASFLASSLLGGSFTYGRAGYFVFLFAGYLLSKSQLISENHFSNPMHA